MTYNTLLVIYATVIGACIGSFLNVVAYRLPREESLVNPPSHCPKCNHKIKPYENIPVISYILLGGKCSSCKDKIAPTYCLIELLTAIAWGGIAYKFGFTLDTIIALIASTTLIVTAVMDYNTMDVYTIIPTVASVCILVTKVIQAILIKDTTSLVVSICATILVIGAFLILGVIYKGKLGDGDVYVFSVLALALPPAMISSSILVTCIAGIITIYTLIFLKKTTKETPFPFIPFILYGYIFTLFLLV